LQFILESDSQGVALGWIGFAFQAKDDSLSRFKSRRMTCIERRMIRLTHEPIDYAALTESVRSRRAGAVVLFLGTVRELTAGRETVALDYEAYVDMAQAKLAEVAAEAREKWPVIEVAIEHRLGHLELGEISVAVAVSCAHRGEAFEAGRYLIDRLKEVVPIWKKENWSDGSTEWVHPGLDASADAQPELLK
jgi:molybdopterin synthase catalytic subunit